MTKRQLAALAVWAVIVAAVGCQSTPPPAPPATTPPPTAATGAGALLEQASRAGGSVAAQLYLNASRAFIDEGDLEQAAAAVERVDLNFLPVTDRARYWLTAATLAERNGATARARELLQRASRAPGADRHAVAMLTSRLCLALEPADYGCAVDALTSAPTEPDTIAQTHDMVWAVMGRAPAQQLAGLAAESQGDAQGWWRLKIHMLSAFSVADQRQRLARWRQQWPDHPANRWPPEAVRSIDAHAQQVRHVALLLPLSGPLSRAGRAVRDGFVSAHLYSLQAFAGKQPYPDHQADRAPLGAPPRAGADRPLDAATAGPKSPRLTITVFDSAAQPTPALLESALVQGADLIIGPLVKSRVEEINALNPLVPVLTLNYLDAHLPSADNVLQLGLAIEDEADTIVGQLLLDNAERVLVFHTYEDWSRRAVKRLQENWPHPLTVQPFTDIRTITEAVGEAMDVQASQQRRDEIARALGVELEFLPRARQDVEAIVALVDTLEANALAPALDFHFARGVPVYASSQTVRGAQPADLRALSGFRVCELPWFLSADVFYQSMDAAFRMRGNPFASLYALGVDAFRVSDQAALLQRDGGTQLIGSTGILSLEANGRFRRQLDWGVVSQDTLAPLASSR